MPIWLARPRTGTVTAAVTVLTGMPRNSAENDRDICNTGCYKFEQDYGGTEPDAKVSTRRLRGAADRMPGHLAVQLHA